MNQRAARHIRAGILDARARVMPWWAPMSRKALSSPYDSELGLSVRAQPRSIAYRTAYERTEARMPLPKPPKGPGGAFMVR